jgi:hypothetical protein
MSIKIRPSPASLSDFLQGFESRFEQFEERNRLGLPADEEFDQLCLAMEAFTAARVPPACLTDEEMQRLAVWFDALEQYEENQHEQG